MRRGIRFAVVLGVALAGATLTAQSTGARKTWTPRLTADGQPDLQGIWTNATITPFERPASQRDKAFLTEAEVAAIERQVATNRAADPKRPGDVGSYDQVWFDSGDRVVSTRRTSLVIDPPDGRVPPLTAEARTREAARAQATRGRGPADSWTDRSLGDRCIVSRNGWPHVVVNAGSYGNIFRIVQSPGYVVLTHEMIHETRIIPVDGRPHISQGIRQYLGDPRGHWEGNTLVVEVTNFSDKTDFRGSRETLRLVERFTRTGPDTVAYAVTIDDPATFTKPWTIGVPLKSDKGQDEIFEYACHEGNYAMRNILSGARADEQAAKAR